MNNLKICHNTMKLNMAFYPVYINNYYNYKY